MDSSGVQTGNAQTDAADRGWFVGRFIDKKLGLQHDDSVEIKWHTYKNEEDRPDWSTSQNLKTICLLIEGRIEIIFRGRTVVLDKQGDFVIWENCDHKRHAAKGTTTLTIRWASAA